MIRARIRDRRAARRGDVGTGDGVQPRRGGLISGLISSAMDSQKSKAAGRTLEDGRFRYDHRDYERSPAVGRREEFGQAARSAGGRYEPFDDRGYGRNARGDFGSRELGYDARGYQRDQRRDIDYAEAGYDGQAYQRGGRGELQGQSYVNNWVEGQGRRRPGMSSYQSDEPGYTLRRIDRGEGSRYQDSEYSQSVDTRYRGDESRYGDSDYGPSVDERQRAPPEYRDAVNS